MPNFSAQRKLLIISLFLVTFFQNCGQPGDISVSSPNLDNLSELQNPIGPSGTSSDLPRGEPAGDFTCQSVVLLPSSSNLSIPARSGNGICYAVKLFDAIEQSPSNLSLNFDQEVISRDHEAGSFTTRNPYVLGSTLFNLKLEGPRNVKLSGGLSSSASIQIDNFVLVGIYPLGVQPITDFYKSYGTKDSTIDSAQAYIEFRKKQILLHPFASGGTATVVPLELVNDLQVNTDYTIDIRALDCGKVRKLSDVYALFQ